MASLQQYGGKRDFSRTREPAPSAGHQGGTSLQFVVQKHAARRLHYDFRLELDGVLKSWAVPRGPSLDPKTKRMAVMVEDHPLEYAAFEGVIADGNYGAGQVIVWDAGVYSPDEQGHLSFSDRVEAEARMRADLERGKLSVTLRGRKLRGSWTLVRTTRSPNEWLLIKHQDRYASSDLDVLQEERSVHSGLTLAELKGGRLPDPMSRGATALTLGRPVPFPARLKPMLARIAERPFSHRDWLFEPKLDGFRVLAYLQHGQVALLSRNGTDLTEQFPSVVEELQRQGTDEMVLDGEMVALNEEGLPEFQLLQQHTGMVRYSKTAVFMPRLVYYAFDLLYVNGTDVRKVPLVQRKQLLSHVLFTEEHVQTVESVDREGEAFFQAALGLGLEGMVGKRRDSLYEAGSRSPSWLKVKVVQEQEFVVGGYTVGAGSRAATFGALLLGYYEGKAFRFAGRVGTGFDEAMLQELQHSLSRLHTEQCPFAPDAELNTIEARWVRPRLVARVKFAQWTPDERLRAPVFLGLRSELAPREVIRETPPLSPPEEEPGSMAPDREVSSVQEQLSGSQDKLLLEVAGYRIGLTNLNKKLWPAADERRGITKGDLIRYYVGMSQVLLPHLRDRPLTFTRYPNGIDGGSFYQKHWDQHPPEFVETVRLFSSHNEGDGTYILVNNLPTLVWLAQLATLELHPWLSRSVGAPDAPDLGTVFAGSKDAIDNSALNYPDFIAFDLDPYVYSGKEQAGQEPELHPRGFSKTVEVAFALKEVLDQLALSSFLKTSGKTGLHIYVPILREYDYGATRKICEIIGRFLMQQKPNDVTMEWSISQRTGKVFFDHNQNVRGKNMASIYSPRPVPGAPVSTPLRWDELAGCYPTDFTMETVPQRVERLGDLWADVLQAKHNLHRLLGGALDT